MRYAKVIEEMSGDIYQYLSFDQIAIFKTAADRARIAAVPV